MRTLHDKLWRNHPGVRSGDELTFGERAADHMKGILATWGALITMAVFIAGWMIINSSVIGRHHEFDAFPWILLNLLLSTLAGLQCFVLLIAGRRGEQIAAEQATHTYENTETIKDLLDQNTRLAELGQKNLEQNTRLTEQVKDLTTQVHTLVSPKATKPKRVPKGKLNNSK